MDLQGVWPINDKTEVLFSLISEKKTESGKIGAITSKTKESRSMELFSQFEIKT